MSEKVVLCYGDSNTWGAVPGREGRRHDRQVRWPGVLAAELGSGWRVVDDGLCGRTTVLDDPVEIAEDKNGMRSLGVALSAHSPIDLVVLMLGTNDLKPRFAFSAFDVAEAAGILVDRVRATVTRGSNLERAPEILVICPPPIEEVGDFFGPMFTGAKAKSAHFHREFARMAGERNVPLLFAEDVLAVDPADGIHYSAAGHAALGKHVAKWIQTSMPL
jgi:lysophospholipase L1-like esterase